MTPTPKTPQNPYTAKGAEHTTHNPSANVERALPRIIFERRQFDGTLSDGSTRAAVITTATFYGKIIDLEFSAPGE